MKLSEIAQGSDTSNRIVRWKGSRLAKRRSDILASICQGLSELEDLSRGVVRADGLDIETVINEAKSAISRLKATLSTR